MREQLVDWEALCRHPQVETLVELALAEDLGTGDVTTQAIFRAPRRARARLLARTPTVMCGAPLARDILRRLDPAVELHAETAEGEEVGSGATLLTLEADVRSLLTGERVMLNFLMRCCGVADGTRQAVGRLPMGVRARVYDTRKTMPGWRLLDKAAVRIGGGANHRVGLFDGVIIKDNHIAAAGSISAALAKVRERVGRRLPIEIEIDRLDQLDEALAGEPDVILLDNFDEAMLTEAVRRVGGRVELEASGGITIERLAAVAATGVDRISMGALTHSARPADLSLELE